MKLKADHVAGAFFVAVGLFVVLLSGDLPFGQMSMPGAGFLPLLIASLIAVFGAVLFLRAGESPSLSTIGWDDAKHAGQVALIAAVAIALYTALGFILSMILMVLALTIIVERRNIARAATYSACVVLVTYFTFVHLLKAPLPVGVLGYW